MELENVASVVPEEPYEYFFNVRPSRASLYH